MNWGEPARKWIEMSRYSQTLKLICFTIPPVLICASLSALVPSLAGWPALFLAGMTSVLMAVILGIRLENESNRLTREFSSQEPTSVGPDQSKRNEDRDFFELLGEQRAILAELSNSSATKIRELTQSNVELSRRYAQFQSILGTMSEGVLLTEAGGKILYCNRSAGVLLGRSQKEIERKQLWEVVRTPGLEGVIEEAIATGNDLREAFELQRTHRIVEMSAIGLDVNSGAGMVIVLHDITELRRLEKMRRDFVSNVSHELKTPLTAIQAYSETLLDGGLEDTGNSRFFVEQIQEQSERLQQLIQDMLRLARIEAQSEAFQLQQISMSGTLAACVEARIAVARARDVTLTCHCGDENGIDIIADQEGLRTIFDNLINNALNYTSEHGRVEVRCWQQGRQAFAEVKDNGIGISKEHHARIFERFYRVDKARSRGMGGTGLGLAIVKHCVNVFHGEIEIESQVGSGTTFRLSFPLVESQALIAHEA